MKKFFINLIKILYKLKWFLLFLVFCIWIIHFNITWKSLDYEKILEFFVILPHQFFQVIGTSISLILSWILFIWIIFNLYLILINKENIEKRALAYIWKFKFTEIRISVLALIVSVSVWGFQFYEYHQENRVKLSLECKLSDPYNNDNFNLEILNWKWFNWNSWQYLANLVINTECRIRNKSKNKVTIEAIKPVWYYSEEIDLKRWINNYSWSQPSYNQNNSPIVDWIINGTDLFFHSNNSKIALEWYDSKLIQTHIVIPIATSYAPVEESVKNNLKKCQSDDILFCLSNLKDIDKIVNSIYETKYISYWRGGILINGLGISLLTYNWLEITTEIDITDLPYWHENDDINILSSDYSKKENISKEWNEKYFYSKDKEGDWSTGLTIYHSLILYTLIILWIIWIINFSLYIKND